MFKLGRRWNFVMKYETPDMVVIYFETEDILTDSLGEGDVDPFG